MTWTSSSSRAVSSPLAVLALAGLLAVGDPSPVQAQFAVSVGGGVGGYTGGDFSGTPAGPTLGVAFHMALFDDATEAVFGIDRSRYDGHGLVGGTRQTDYRALLRRSVFAGWPEIRIGALLGYSTRSLSLADEPARADGFLTGPTLSLRAPAPMDGAFEVSTELLYHSYEELIMYAAREYGTDQDGFRLLLRMGIVVPLPGGPTNGDRADRWPR